MLHNGLPTAARLQLLTADKSQKTTTTHSFGLSIIDSLGFTAAQSHPLEFKTYVVTVSTSQKWYLLNCC